MLLIVWLVTVGCQKKPVDTTDTVDDTWVAQETGGDIVDLLDTGDLSDPEIEEIIGLLEEMVAEDDTGTQEQGTGLQDQEVKN